MMNDDDKYKALVEKSKDYDGAFYAGVKTTGIFCRTVCTARKPLRENVVFYNTVQEAMAAGFRPCKICRPMEAVDEIPPAYAKLIQALEDNPNQKIKEYDLRQRGIDPNTLRRWFQKHYGMSFQAYARMYRISQAFGAVKDGEKVLDAALESGYSSISGFNSAFEKLIGASPKNSRQSALNILLYKRFDTPLGPMIAIASDEGLCLMEFGDRRMLETEFIDLKKRLRADILPGTNGHIETGIKEMMAYFSGALKTFTVKLHTPGTAFQNEVWQGLRGIGYGEIESYKQLAIRIGNPSAVRAVGRANGMNRLAIIIPCHRVIGANGELTGYGGGLWRKEWLIAHEKKHSR